VREPSAIALCYDQEVDDSLIREKVINDFVFSDRRLIERPDIAIHITPIHRAEVKERAQLRTAYSSYPKPFLGTPPAYPRSHVSITTSASLRDDERKRLEFLADLVRFFDASEQERRSDDLLFKVGRQMYELRQALRVDAGELAQELSIDGETLSLWERGAESPASAMYAWGLALGVFCPANKALVRVIDISPQLLRVLRENPEELHRLQPDQFESLVANRLDRMGYNVKLTGPTNRKDGGIDIIAVPKTMNVGSYVLAAQVKHHQGVQKVGRDAVDKLASWNGPFRLGMLVTNTAFTKDAIWAAAQERNRHFLRLRDFKHLKLWLHDQYGSPEDWREIPDTIELAPGVVIEIPKPKRVVGEK
jgi:restriction endonuclease